MDRAYLCIDLKSFYASVECVARGLDPMTADLVVADPERGGGTICLAVSPHLKALGVKNRCRVFEIPKNIPYIMATPRMQLYFDTAAAIYGVYLKRIAPDDIHVYSIDEAFFDVTPYLGTYRTTPRELGRTLTEDVFRETGIRATCGIGTNLYLAKIALDILAKHSPDFMDELTEETYRERLWDHRPLTDFWRIGRGTAATLARYGIDTMRGIAGADPELLFRLFGIDAELLYDHSWGRETCTMADIKAYRPKTRSLSTGQVLMRDYTFPEARLVVREMADALSHDLVRNGLVTGGVVLYVVYSGKLGLPPVRGTASFTAATNSVREIVRGVTEIYERVTDARLPVRRLNLTAIDVAAADAPRQLTIGELVLRNGAADRGRSGPDDPASLFRAERERERDRREQEAIVAIRKRYGNNALLKGMDLEEAATTRARNGQIGGHRK